MKETKRYVGFSVAELDARCRKTAECCPNPLRVNDAVKVYHASLRDCTIEIQGHAKRPSSDDKPTRTVTVPYIQWEARDERYSLRSERHAGRSSGARVGALEYHERFKSCAEEQVGEEY